MSKLKTRIILSIVISLGVIFAIATTVQGASLNLADSASSHSASGALTTYAGQIVTERDAYQAELDAHYSPGRDGRDCGDKYGPID